MTSCHDIILCISNLHDIKWPMWCQVKAWISCMKVEIRSSTDQKAVPVIICQQLAANGCWMKYLELLRLTPNMSPVPLKASLEAHIWTCLYSLQMPSVMPDAQAYLQGRTCHMIMPYDHARRYPLTQFPFVMRPILQIKVTSQNSNLTFTLSLR